MAKPIQRTLTFVHNGKSYTRHVWQSRKHPTRAELASDEDLIASWKATLDRAEKLKQKKK
mgnify:CR=1|jgi:hypothetical protein|tara:strand:- start:668 stop:847 length:180 start_codon:yes stop_codon:yes gene_type:complete